MSQEHGNEQFIKEANLKYQGPVIYTFDKPAPWGSELQERLGYKLPRAAGYAVSFERTPPHIVKYQLPGIAIMQGQRYADNPSTEIEAYKLTVRPFKNLKYPEQGIPLIQATVYRDIKEDRMTILEGDFTCRTYIGNKGSYDEYRISYEPEGTENIDIVNRASVVRVAGYNLIYLNDREIEKLGLDKLGFPETVDFNNTFSQYRWGLAPNAEGVIGEDSVKLTAERIYDQPLLPYIAPLPSAEDIALGDI